MEEQKSPKKVYTPLQAKLKAESYCAYQERSQQEVRDALYKWGLYPDEIEQLISELIADNFLNEERFAIAYALGKFRMKGWGKVKIKHQLKAKRVSEPLIRIALGKIDLDDYLQRLDDTIAKKANTEVKLLSASDRNKLIRYLQGKGYENTLIFERIPY